VELCALREMTSTDLIAAADDYTDLGSLKDEIALDAPPPRESRNDAEAAPPRDRYEAIDPGSTSFDF
jgi:hypothetical protein